MTWRRTFCAIVVLSAVALALLVTHEVHAQFLGHNLPGDFGIYSGSQAPPGRYVGTYETFCRSNTIKIEEGRTVGGRADSDLSIWAIATFVSIVTEFKLLGGNYGFVAIPNFSNASLEIPRLDVDQGQFGFGDLYIVPFQLDWHWERTDLTTSYGFFAPTGRYEPGANDNIGLGMWSHEFSVGFTQYLDSAKTRHIATSALMPNCWT